jgi:S-adenosylmethionine:tRNA ribosyltransferase-isomerase
MHIGVFDYDLPEELIAQSPSEHRDQSRLLVLRGETERLSHHVFADLVDLLAPGDLLVLNDTMVVAARLVGHRARTRGKWEGLFVRQQPDGLWELLVQTRGHLEVGESLVAESPAGPTMELTLVEKVPPGRWLVRPQVTGGSAGEVLSRFGQVPIPPYIRKGRAELGDTQRYQTIYARHEGAVAAPTAGLHFTSELFKALGARGIERAFVTLHVGPGTFQPVKVEDVSQHRVEPEWGELPGETVRAIAACKSRGGRVVAVGTTTVRLLERAALLPPPEHQQLSPYSGLVDLTICPPFTFRVVDALITNFHLPRSSLLLLVSAFAGLERVRLAYQEAVRCHYRFYSYGDAMLVV